MSYFGAWIPESFIEKGFAFIYAEDIPRGTTQTGILNKSDANMPRLHARLL